MKGIAGLVCLLFGCIFSVNGDAVTMTTWAALENPGEVSDFRVLQQNARSLSFDWRGPPKGRHFEVCVYDTRPSSTLCRITDKEYETIDQLRANTNYSIRVTAVRLNAVNKIAIAGTPHFASAKTICERSSVVKDLRVSTVTSSSVTLFWIAPQTVCGSLSRYEVLWWRNFPSNDKRESVGIQWQIQWQSTTINNLLPNTAYTFSVAAISTEPSGMELLGDVDNVTRMTNPGEVSDFRVLQHNVRSVHFVWQGPPNSRYFEVCVYDTQPSSNLCRITDKNNETRGELLADTNYSIRVTAVRLKAVNTIEVRGTPYFASAKTICQRSSFVKALIVSNVTSSSVTLTWNAPETVCGDLVQYEVRTQQTALHYDRRELFRIHWQSVTIENLLPNTAYRFSVAAISTEPSGMQIFGYAENVTATTNPGSVTDLRVLQENSRSVFFTWKGPLNTEQFEVCVSSTSPGQYSCQYKRSNNDARTNLHPKTSYTIRVRAVRLNAESKITASGTPNFAIATTICETSDPVKIRSSNSASSHIVLSWKVPTAVCGTLVNIAVSYFKRTTINKRISDVQRNVYDVTATEVYIASLAANTLYNFTVTAQTREPSGRDSSGASDTVELRTAPSSVTHLETMRVTSNSFEAQWTAPHEGQDSQLLYQIRLYLLSSNASELKKSISTSDTSVAFDELEATSAYRLEVTTSNLQTTRTRNYGVTSIINLRTDCTTPFQPVITNGITPSLNMDMQVAWQHDARGCLNISYVIFVTFLNGTSHFETSDQWIVIRDLQPYTSYSVVVSAVRTDGLNRRAFSNSSTVFAVTQADAPRGLTVQLEQIDTSSAVVVWEPPTRWNGQPGGYVIALVMDNGTFTTFYTKNANDTKHNFVDLQPSSYYEVQLVAFNNRMNSSVKRFNFTTSQLPVSAAMKLEIMIPGIVSVVLIAVAAVFVGLWMNRRRAKPEKASSQELSPLALVKTDGSEKMSNSSQRRAKQNPKLLMLEESTCDAPRDDVYGNASAVGISLAAFPTFVRSQLSETAPFTAEFKDLKTSITSLQTSGQKPSNKTKNKFKDIIPYDESRVILTPQSSDTDTDYINASFIEGYGGKQRRYIAAQGPTNDTVEDFWRMVLEYRSEVIVMVTRLVEAGVTKCVWYWPESGTKVYGNIQVTLHSSDEFPDYQINVLQVVQKADGSRLTVKHFYYTSWPDHGVPDYALSMLKFRRNVVAFTGSTDSPTIVHCSAGVGRTGTYIAIDYLLNEARASGRVNVKLCVERLREQRPKMVQTREQYAFIYQAVMEATQAGDTSIACERFCSYYQKLTKNSNELLKKEHEIFAKAIQPLTRESCSVALLPENSKKNVTPEILPANQKRPILLTRSSSEGETDYINAVFLNTSKKKDGFIVTQTPLPHTKGDFWRMVLDYRVGTIVALDSFRNKKAKYWPEIGEDFVLGDVLSVNGVKSSPDGSGTVRTRDFRVNRAKASDGFAVRQFEFLNWPSSDPCPKDESSLLELISSIDKWTAQAEGSTVLVHCSNGAYKSGLLVAAMNALRCAEAEQVVDVYMTGLLLRQHRPQFLCNEEQYYYLYKIMASFVETFDTYANFLPSSS